MRSLTLIQRLRAVPGRLWSRRHLLALLLLFALTRVLFILASDHASVPQECLTGALGPDLARGELRLPLWLYQVSPEAGGSVFTGVASLPFHWLLGNPHAAAKLTALCFSLLTLTLIYVLIRRQYQASDRLAAGALAPLFVLSTPHSLQKSVLQTGSAGELTLVVVLVTLIFFSLMRSTRWSCLKAGLLGLCCGLGLWIHPGLVALALAVVGCWFVRDRLLFLTREFWVFALSGLVGLTPLLIYNATYGFAPLRLRQLTGQRLFNHDPAEILDNGFELLALHLPRSFHFFEVGPLDGRVFAYTLYALLGLLIGSLVARGRLIPRGLLSRLWPPRRRPAEPRPPTLHGFWLLVLLLVFCLLAASNLPFGDDGSRWNSLEARHEHYLAFALPLLHALAAAGLVQLLASPEPRARGAGVAGLLLITVTLLPCFAAMLRSTVDSPARPPAAGCPCGNVRQAGMAFRGHPLMLQRLLYELAPGYRASLLQGAGFGWYLQCCDRVPGFGEDPLNESLTRLPTSQRSQLFRAFMNTPAPQCEQDPEQVQGCLEQLLDPHFQPLFREQRVRRREAPEPHCWLECRARAAQPSERL